MADYGFAQPFLDSHPEIESIVKTAEEGGWEMDKFMDAIKKTKWWKGRSDAQRRFEVTEVENPGEVAASIEQANQAVATLAAQMGVGLSAKMIATLGRSMVKNGLNEDMMRASIARMYRTGKGGLSTTGVAGKSVADLQEMAGNYGVKISKNTLRTFSANIAQGLASAETYEDFFREQAKMRYGAVAAQLDQGFTTRQILDPYLQAAAEELGINPATMNISDGKWNRAIQYVPKRGEQVRPMTDDEWQTTLRTDPKYGWDSTQNAQRAGATLANEIMTRMGAMG